MQTLMYSSHTCDVQHTRAAYPSRIPQLTAESGWHYWRQYISQCYIELECGYDGWQVHAVHWNEEDQGSRGTERGEQATRIFLQQFTIATVASHLDLRIRNYIGNHICVPRMWTPMSIKRTSNLATTTFLERESTTLLNNPQQTHQSHTHRRRF